MPMIWNPEPIWANRTVIVVGGGPSLRGFDFTRLRYQRVLAINEAFLDLPWADLLYFRDCDWFDRNRAGLSEFAGFIVTTSPASAEAWPEKVKLIQANTSWMPRARTSGHQSVALAMRLGACKIILIGFDWNPDGGNYHDRYQAPGLRYRGGLLSSWGWYRRHAAECGVEILNATPASGIRDFPIIDLSEILWR